MISAILTILTIGAVTAYLIYLDKWLSKQRSKNLKSGCPKDTKYSIDTDGITYYVDSYTKDGDCIKFFTNENETSKSIVLCGEYTIIEN